MQLRIGQMLQENGNPLEAQIVGRRGVGDRLSGAVEVGIDGKTGILRHQSVETGGQTPVGDLTGLGSMRETPQVPRIGRHYLMDERYPEMSMDKIDIVESFNETIMDFLAGMMEPYHRCHHRHLGRRILRTGPSEMCLVVFPRWPETRVNRQWVRLGS